MCKCNCCSCCCQTAQSSSVEPSGSEIPSSQPSPDPIVVKLETWEHDNRNGNYRVFYRDPGSGHVYVGNYPDLDDREIEWNDIIRSVVLHGPPGTSVWVYDSKGYGDGDDILELKVPPGKTSVISNNLDTITTGMRWVHHKNGIAGKVSGIRWVDGVIENDIALLTAGLNFIRVPNGKRIIQESK